MTRMPKRNASIERAWLEVAVIKLDNGRYLCPICSHDISERVHVKKVNNAQVDLMREVMDDSDRTIKRARAASSSASVVLGKRARAASSSASVVLGNAPEVVNSDGSQETIPGDIPGDVGNSQETIADTQVC